ncbi:unnamed protein product [Larinioides sclopetarius]|uniref:Uncharacterized protein n=1 Tax=Larinioides sclopetarius TaxID=280406 RepID=A0AAV2ANZ8_9ARAC
MGSYFGKSVDENFKRNQEFMMQLQRLQLERQIHMRNQIRERKLALKIATYREFFYWVGTFYVLAAGSTIFAYGLLYSAISTKMCFVYDFENIMKYIITLLK